jgi:NitT/TauT family transport system permease protein
LLVLQMLAVPLAILLVWELSGRLGWIARGILPSPTAVAQGWWQWAVGHDAMGLNAYSGT